MMLKKLIFPKILQRLEETRWDGRACLKGFLWIEGMYSKELPQTLHTPFQWRILLSCSDLLNALAQHIYTSPPPPANEKIFKLDVLLQPLISLLSFFMKSPCHTPSAGSSSTLLICLYFRLVSSRNKITPDGVNTCGFFSLLSSLHCKPRSIISSSSVTSDCMGAVCSRQH